MDMPPIDPLENFPVPPENNIGGRIESRLAALERKTAVLAAENVALRAKCVQLESGRPRSRGVPGDIVDKQAAPRAFVEQGTRVMHVATQLSADQPSDEELRSLREICRRQFPEMCDSSGYVETQRGPPDKVACEAEWLHQLGRSILALGGMRKIPQPNERIYACGQHVEHARAFLRAAGKYTKELRAAPFLMGCFVMNVPISGLNVDGAVICLGLAVGDGAGQEIPPGTWRDTLAAGQLPRQHRVSRNPAPAPTQTRIYAQGHATKFAPGCY